MVKISFFRKKYLEEKTTLGKIYANRMTVGGQGLGNTF